ncbi:restriction endonuclease subunit S [Rothia sp. P4278]|uniref:restriction endonuclease subunit S n=1 Tax=Rothia sp. P4278 TaxID=3402658 RepID=UPI003ADF32D0
MNEHFWDGDFPLVPLGYLLSKNDGGTWGNDPTGEQDTLVLRSTEQTQDGKWIIDDPAPRSISSSEKARTALELGDLLVTKSSGSQLHIGKTTIVDESVLDLNPSFSNFMQRLRLKPGHYPKYFWYVFQSSAFKEALKLASTTSTGLANITGGLLASIKVPVPSLDEQKKISNNLDRELAEIDGLIADQLKLKELLKEQFEAKKEQVILEAGGQEVRLSRVLKGLKDGTHGTHPRVSSGGEVLLSAKNISSGELVISEDESRISLEEAAQITASGFPKKGDVMMILVGATYGRTSLYNLDQTLPFQRSVGFFRPNEKLITSDYLKLVMSSHKFQQQLSLGIKTSAQPGIYLGDVASCMINLPKWNSQLSAAKKYHSAEKIYKEITTDIDKSIENLIELRSSLLSTSFCS